MKRHCSTRRALCALAVLLLSLPSVSSHDDHEVDNHPVPLQRHVYCDSALIEGGVSTDLTPLFTLHWSLSNSMDTFEAALEYRGQGWVALGFDGTHTGKMVGSQAVIGIPNSSPKLYSLIGQDPHAPKESIAVNTIGTQEAYEIVGTTAQNDSTTVLAFEMTSFSQLAKPDSSGHYTLLYAAGSTNTLGYHDHSGSFRMHLQACGKFTDSKNGAQQQQQHQSTSDTYKALFAAHGFFATLAFGIVVPIALSAAWFRTLIPKWWIYVHVLSNCLAFFFTMIAVACGIAGVSLRSTDAHFSQAHHVVGLLLFILLVTQVTNGFCRPQVEDKSERGEPSGSSSRSCLPQSRREQWHWLHRVTAVVIIALALYQLHSGLVLYTSQYTSSTTAQGAVIVYWIWVALLVVVLLSLYCFVQSKLKSKRRRDAARIPETNIMPQRSQEESCSDYDENESNNNPYAESSKRFANII